MGQVYLGNSAISLREFLGIDNRYAGYRVQYVSINATAMQGQSTVVLYSNGVPISNEQVIYGSQTIFLSPNTGLALGYGELQIYIFGSTYLGSIDVQLQ